MGTSARAVISVNDKPALLGVVGLTEGQTLRISIVWIVVVVALVAAGCGRGRRCRPLGTVAA